MYKCCRCGYSTNNKTSIKKHLYDRKTQCPPSNCKIKLIDKIRENILRDTIYITNDSEFKDSISKAMIKARLDYLHRLYIVVYEVALIDEYLSEKNTDNLIKLYSFYKKYDLEPFLNNVNIDIISKKEIRNIYENTTEIIDNKYDDLIMKQSDSVDVSLNIIESLSR